MKNRTPIKKIRLKKQQDAVRKELENNAAALMQIAGDEAHDDKIKNIALKLSDELLALDPLSLEIKGDKEVMDRMNKIYAIVEVLGEICYVGHHEAKKREFDLLVSNYNECYAVNLIEGYFLSSQSSNRCAKLLDDAFEEVINHTTKITPEFKEKLSHFKNHIFKNAVMDLAVNGDEFRSNSLIMLFINAIEEACIDGRKISDRLDFIDQARNEIHGFKSPFEMPKVFLIPMDIVTQRLEEIGNFNERFSNFPEIGNQIYQECSLLVNAANQQKTPKIIERLEKMSEIFDDFKRVVGCVNIEMQERESLEAVESFNEGMKNYMTLIRADSRLNDDQHFAFLNGEISLCGREAEISELRDRVQYLEEQLNASRHNPSGGPAAKSSRQFVGKSQSLDLP